MAQVNPPGKHALRPRKRNDTLDLAQRSHVSAKKSTFNKELEALSAVLEALDGLEPAEQEFVMNTASGRLGIKAAPARPNAGGSGGESGNSGSAGERGGSRTQGQPQNAKQFLKEKKPDSDIQRIAVLAYYLNNYGEKEAFDAKDLVKLNTDAGGVKIGNPSRAMDNATRGAGFLTNLPGRKKKISAHGEEVVDALPDQNEVKRLQKEHKGARRRTKATRKRATRKSTQK
jgi:hypothetical protein